MGFINQQINTWFKFNTWICKLQLGFFPLHHSLCILDIESGKIRIEGRKMAERGRVVFRNGDLLDMYNVGNVKYCFVLWSCWGMRVHELDRCWLLGIIFKYTFVYSEKNNQHRLWSAPNNSRNSVSLSWQFTLKIVTNICIIIPLFVDF